MSEFLVILNPSGQHGDTSVIAEIMEGMRDLGKRKRRLWSSGQLAVGALIFNVGASGAREDQPVVSDDKRWVLIADVRLDNRDELRRQLRDTIDTALLHTDTQLLLAAWLRWGEKCGSHLLGDYAFCVYDQERNVLFGTVDPLGIRRLFIAEQKNGQVFIASDESFLLTRTEFRQDWNRPALCRWLMGSPDRERSLFKKIRVIACGRTWIRSGTHDTCSEPWSPAHEPELHYKSVNEYAEHYLELTTEAVRARTDSRAGGVASELSGGLDSSSVTTLLSELAANCSVGAVAISQLFPCHEPSDESHYIRETIEKTKINHIGFDASSIVERCFPLQYMARPYDGIGFRNPVQEQTLELAADHGADVLLTGLGGDELLQGDPRWSYAERLLAGEVSVIAELAKSAAMVRQGPGRRLGRYLLRPLVQMLLDSRIPLFRGGGYAAAIPPWLELDDGLRASCSWNASYPADCDFAFRSQQEMWNVARGGASLLAVDDYRAIGRSYGVDVRCPFYDLRLWRFAYAIPPGLLRRAGWSKWLARRAMDSKLPASVGWRVDRTDFSEIYRNAWSRNHVNVVDFLGATSSVQLPSVNNSRITAATSMTKKNSGVIARQLLFLFVLLSWVKARDGHEI